MKKIAVFGRPGGGKSTLSRRLSEVSSIPLYPLDLIEYRSGGARVESETFDKLHTEILACNNWIIDGFGTIATFRQRIAEADTLIYVNRPIWLHYWWVAKRLLLSPVKGPEGWPERSPMIRSTMTSWVTLYRSRSFWDNTVKSQITALSSSKRVRIIASQKDELTLLSEIQATAKTVIAKNKV